MDTIILKRENFSKFLNIIRLIQEECKDCDVVNGTIRCNNDDTHSLIHINLTEALGESTTFALGFLNRSSRLLSSFELDDSVNLDEDEKDVILEIEPDKRIIFKDIYSDLSFKAPARRLMSNTYIDKESFEKKFNLVDEDLAFSYNVSSYICKRIKNISQVFEASSMTWKLNGDKATLETEALSKDKSSVLVKDIPLRKSFDPSIINMISFPLRMDINADVQVDAYDFNRNGMHVMVVKFFMKYFGIPISIYAHSQIQKGKGKK